MDETMRGGRGSKCGQKHNPQIECGCTFPESAEGIGMDTNWGYWALSSGRMEWNNKAFSTATVSVLGEYEKVTGPRYRMKEFITPDTYITRPLLKYQNSWTRLALDETGTPVFKGFT